MAVIRTKAILLRSFPYSETSRILRFLTASHGLVGVLARGVRKQASKGLSNISPFSVGELVFDYRETRDLQSLREFSVSNAHLGLARDLSRLSGASVMADVLLKHSGVVASDELVDQVEAAFRRLEDADTSDVSGEALAQLWSLVAALGFAPETMGCISCGTLFDQEGLARFDFSGGGLRCEDCELGGRGPRLGPGAREQLRQLLLGQVPEGLQKTDVHLRLLDDFMTFHVLEGQRMESFRFLRESVERHE